MAQFIYIDETGSVGKGAKHQPLLTLMAVIVDEDKVQDLAAAMQKVTWAHLGWIPADFEFHGVDLWGGTGHWAGKTPTELIAAYEAVIQILVDLDLSIAHASIHKANLHARYGGAADANAYRLALQFLLEKVDRYGNERKILIADEAKEQRLRAIKLVANLQDWGGQGGEVPGVQLKTIIDTLHYVESQASPGVQMADLAAFAFQRRSNGRDKHPDAIAAIGRINSVVAAQTRTYRWSWP